MEPKAQILNFPKKQQQEFFLCCCFLILNNIFNILRISVARIQ